MAQRKKRPATAKEGSRGKRRPGKLPVGITLRLTLTGHDAPIARVAWSPSGELLATASDDGTVRVWDPWDGSERARLTGPGGHAVSVSWSPNGELLVAGFDAGVAAGGVAQTFNMRSFVPEANAPIGRSPQVAWSPDGRVIAFASSLGVGIWDPASEQLTIHDRPASESLADRYPAYYGLSWSLDGTAVIAGGNRGAVLVKPGDGTTSLSTEHGGLYNITLSSNLGVEAQINPVAVDVVRSSTRSHVVTLEGHGETWGAAFSEDGRALATVGPNRLKIWRCDRWERLADCALGRDDSRPKVPPNLAFAPHRTSLAVPIGIDVLVLDIDLDTLLGAAPSSEASHYSNAKVVLVGNTSVGKSGLGLVLSGKRFRPTESTHGRHVWVFNSEKAMFENGVAGTRETLLWDLAGQPGYRLIHQMHLAEVVVALVLFDSRSETDPFAGVAYWARALDDATRGRPLVKFLVASRSDRGGPQVSRARIDEVLKRFGYSGFFETSAKRGDGIAEIKQAITQAIPWKNLPHVSASQTFKAAKDFLIRQKRSGKVLQNVKDLFTKFAATAAGENLTEELFSACLERLDTVGLVRRLSFGNNVLLQPERLDDYCGWLAHAARAQPDGLGYISEEETRAGQFAMDPERQLNSKPDEEAMLLATIEEVVSHNIAYRQATEKGAMLVFPSELSADLPHYPGGYSLAVVFQFEGPVSGTYATLAVTLINSTAFKKKELYKNAALFVGPQDRVCGFAVEQPDHGNDAVGRLTVFFDTDTDRSIRLLFLRYVNQQLERLAFRGTLRRDRLYYCGRCKYAIPTDVVDRRRAEGHRTVLCPVNGEQYPLDDLAEQAVVPDSEIEEIGRSASAERERQTRLTTLDERKRTTQYHVFLCHNGSDKAMVRLIEARLLEQGILPWFDEQLILPGDRFAPSIESAIDTARVVAIFIGPRGIGRWQDMEYHAALQRSVEQRDGRERAAVRLIPVLLPGVSDEPDLPAFLRGLNYVDLRELGPDNREGIRRLVAAILLDPGAPFGLLA